MFHDGMRALQDEFDGRRVADALEARRKHREFWAGDIALIAEASFFFVASHHGDAVDCSFKGGMPGFVQVVGPAALEWPDYDGNSMYRTLGNISRSARIGLLFIRFDGASDLLRMTGDATLLRDAEVLSRHHGAKSVVRFEADYIFPNCPRYIPELRQAAASPHPPAPGVTPPAPAWKSRDYLRGELPAGDPHRATADPAAKPAS